jgi:hypothetical protein
LQRRTKFQITTGPAGSRRGAIGVGASISRKWWVKRNTGHAFLA